MIQPNSAKAVYSRGMLIGLAILSRGTSELLPFHQARAAGKQVAIMDTLTLFGLFAVSGMLLTYALEKRSAWFILAFAAFCALGSLYGFLQGAWPFGLVEAVWAVVAAVRWRSVARKL